MNSSEDTREGTEAWKAALAAEVGRKVEDKVQGSEDRIANNERRIEAVGADMKKYHHETQATLAKILAMMSAKDTHGDSNDEKEIVFIGADYEKVPEILRDSKVAHGQTKFDARRVYARFVEPDGFDERTINEFAGTTVLEYVGASDGEVDEMFCYDFKFWEQKHFDLPDTKVRKSIRNPLAEKGGIMLPKGRNRRMSKVLAEHVEHFRAEQAKNLAKICARVAERESNINADANRFTCSC